MPNHRNQNQTGTRIEDARQANRRAAHDGKAGGVSRARTCPCRVVPIEQGHPESRPCPENRESAREVMTMIGHHSRFVSGLTTCHWPHLSLTPSPDVRPGP